MQAPRPKLSQCLSGEATRERENMYEILTEIQVLSNKSFAIKKIQAELFMRALFFIIKGMINRCFVDIKLFQAGFCQFTNTENRKLIPPGMLLYITVFFSEA